MRNAGALLVALALVGAMASGCNKPAQEAAVTPVPGGTVSTGEPAAATPAAAPAVAAKADDVKLKCPVMGTVMAKKDMIPVEIPGKTVYVCCSSCIDVVKKDPEKYAKMPQDPVKE